MQLPDISRLKLRSDTPTGAPALPDDIAHATEGQLFKLKTYAASLPYKVEPNAKMKELLDFIILRLVQCVEAKDYDPGLIQWDSMLTYWLTLKYPLPRERRVQLVRMYYHIAITPGMPTHIVSNCADTVSTLTSSRKKININDLRLPWKPVQEILSSDLFLRRRQFEISQVSWYMGFIASICRRFYHPAAIDSMLSTFVPLFNGTNLDSMLSSQYYMLTFLPQSHPQSYLPMLFRLWTSVNSYTYDDRMLQFLAQLSEMHMDPAISDPKKIDEIPDDARSDGEDRPDWDKNDLKHDPRLRWSGIYKDVGIFTDEEWQHIMCKCLASMEIPLKDSGSLSTSSSADGQAGFEVARLPKATWRITSLARIVVYSMAPDGIPSAPSGVPTPMTPMTPFSGAMTPLTPATPTAISSGNLGDYLSMNLARKALPRIKTYLAGSKALDSLVHLIASIEGFFHPANSGSWTNDLSAFIKTIVYEFNKRWHEEQLPDCPTPKHRRLTREMKRELVKSLRTVSLLAMFSSDPSTVSNIQSCMKSMSCLEPDLILYPILERAFPALEALVETQRTLALIKALGAVAPAIVCREVYYPGAKHLVPILQALLPGIDLNDPSKTLCTTAFLVEISQYIMIGELSGESPPREIEANVIRASAASRAAKAILANGNAKHPSFKLDSYGYAESSEPDSEPQLSDEEEDMLVRESTSSFADWIASLVRRVILLLENLPEEGASGSAGGATEGQVVDAVTGACSQICIHLSEPLFDLVLNMIFDYASNNVRSNCVRAIHQLVECVANANPEKTLRKFVPFCERNIRVELEHGASSQRTTSDSAPPLASDQTLHWNLAILRGAMYNDGLAVLKYRHMLLPLLKLLHRKTLSKRGYTWTGRLLSSVLLTLTHTYPTENRFVNPDEWNSEEFRRNHHRHWGKLYSPEDVKVSWHVPCADEIEFALEIFRELVEPTLNDLDGLLADGVDRDAVWRNDFCRHLNLVRDAFAGIPTLTTDNLSDQDWSNSHASSDILDEIPEMIAHLDSVQSGFPLTDPQDPRAKYLQTLRRRFGELLHRASASLQCQGEYNTVDAVHMLLRSIRTYMLEYGDSRDSYVLQSDQYESERAVTRHYAKQKIWPRAVFIRRARLYHAARLRWNSMERQRGILEDQLIDDLAEWAMWHYVTVRQSSQTLLQSICSSYDGVRRRCLPRLYAALVPGTDDDRMKGALWTLSVPVFAKYAVSEPTLATNFMRNLFSCQHHEKPSIQSCVQALLDNSLTSFIEPNFTVYSVPNEGLSRSLSVVKNSIPYDQSDECVLTRCRDMRERRISSANKSHDNTTTAILEVANSSKTHWRYAIVAIRCLRALIRSDQPMNPQLVKCMMQKTYDSHHNLRYYSQRAVMKCTRYLKLRTLGQGPVDHALERSHNPLRRASTLFAQTHERTTSFLMEFKTPLDIDKARQEALLCEKPRSGWLTWDNDRNVFLLPNASQSPFPPWDPSNADTIAVIREFVTSSNYWTKLSAHFAAETHSDVISQDHATCIKSIFQMLGEAPLDAVKPVLEKLLANKDKNKQRGAADILAGILAASKHWQTDAQERLWQWFTPYIKRIFVENIKTETLLVWTSFIEYVFCHRDPRRLQQLVDFIVDQHKNADYNSESSFDAVKTLCFYRAFYEELGWKSSAWMGEGLARMWPELTGEHDEVRGYIAELLNYSGKIMMRPKPTVPSAEVFVKECRTMPTDFDIMGIRGGYHEGRVLELAKKFDIWREQRLPGVRAFQSTYDKVGIATCKWLYQAIHDTHAISVFDYILTLMPELFRFTELHDNDELALRSDLLLVRMCGVTPPPQLIEPILNGIFDAIQKSTSWRVRLKALPLLQVFYFRQLPQIDDEHIVNILEVLCKCLDDEVIEVRAMAATTLSGILRLSPRRSVHVLRERFTKIAKGVQLPDRKSPAYALALRKRHSAILGICALIDSYPYTVERWMPELLTAVLAEYTYDPIPISTTVRKCAASFRKTHQDTWHEDSKRFNETQLAALSTLLTGSSYYA